MAEKKKWAPTKMFLQWCLSYLLISVIALTLLLASGYRYLDVLRDNLEYTNGIQLDMTRVWLDQKVKLLRNITAKESSTAAIEAVRQADDYDDIPRYDYYMLTRKISTDVINYGIGDAYFLYFPSTDAIVSNTKYGQSRRFYDLVLEAYDISYEDWMEILKQNLVTTRVFQPVVQGKEKAEISAKLYADASRDGVYTHGLNRFPKFIKSIHDGIVDIHAEPVLKESFGAFERYDGCHGPGNLNAYACTKRAIELAKQNTIGCVALANTNHWMRPGNYGLMAVEQNCIGIFWTNTVPNMPPWGGRDARLGNNPITLAIPHGDTPVLVDVAMSMFSYGKLEVYKRSGRPLPVDGGLNKNQQPTRNAAEILETHESYPIGYWKGSGLSLALDLIASALAGGRTTRQVGELPLETELSQVFICINLDSLPDKENIAANVEATLRDMETSTPVEEGRPVHFPGAHMAEVRSDNMENGIPVEDAIWQQVLAL